MKIYNRIIFVAGSGTCRAPMAAAIMQDYAMKYPGEILARGLDVLVPEPLNQKAEAVMISNGIMLEDYSSMPLAEEDITENALVFVMEQAQRKKVLENFRNASEENVYVLTDFVGDELEIMNPYGGTLQAYGLCYETLRQTIKKLVQMLNENEGE